MSDESRRDSPTPLTVDGGDGSRVFLQRSGERGPPLLLIHSINAAASMAEVEPLRSRFAATHRVYCMDLPGFGSSERSDRAYTPRLMTDGILKVAEHIHQIEGVPIDALAVSLSCEFLARAAVENAAPFRSVALVSPTGFSGSRIFRKPRGQTRGKAWLYALLRNPGWGPWLYGQLTRPKVIRYFLERTWGSKQIDEALWQTDIHVAQHPGAYYAPLYFLSAILFSADIHDIYDSLSVPVWASHGQRGDFVDYRQLQAFAERGHWRTSVYSTGALPYFEIPEEFAADWNQFLSLKDSERARVHTA